MLFTLDLRQQNDAKMYTWTEIKIVPQLFEIHAK